MDELRVRNPSVNEKLIATRTRAYQSGNVNGVQWSEIILSPFCQTLGRVVDPTERGYSNLLKMLIFR